LAKNIGRIVSLIEAQVEAGRICDKEREYVLIYNVQMSGIPGGSQVTVDMLCKPREAMLDGACHVLQGRPFHLLVDIDSGLVTNPTLAMLRSGLISDRDVEEEKMEPPTTYGNVGDYPTTTSFVALESAHEVDLSAICEGDYDTPKGVQELGRLTPFTSLDDAFKDLRHAAGPTTAVLELACPTDAVSTAVQDGLSKYVIKIMEPGTKSVLISSAREAIAKEAEVHQELRRLHEAFPDFRTSRTAGSDQAT
jgi:hypothetical protein